MNRQHHVILSAAGIFLAGTASTLAATHYVDQSSTNAMPPYTNWSTAATNIQSAVDAAAPGDEIVATNGVYAGGVRINNSLTVRSVNGPQFTTIVGGGPCVSLASNTGLSGFTVTGGSSSAAAGGVYCVSASAVVSNCVVQGNSAHSFYSQMGLCDGGDAFGGGVFGGTLNNCTLANNSAQACQKPGPGNLGRPYRGYGGGAYGCILNNCTLTGNSAGYGGGAYECILNNCTLTGNLANDGDFGSGGGALNSTLNNCTLTSNTAHYDGGGVYGGTLNSCTLKGNSASFGGGASGGALKNCTLTGNTASRYYGIAGYVGSGGGAYMSTLANCTLTGNSGGGAIGCTLTNCIAYFNTESNYDPNSTLNYCCTTPLPAQGVGNISSDPQLASASRLSPFSPCIGKGTYAAVSGTDIDGEPWANPPSMGCDEYHAGAVTGPLSVAFSASFTNFAVGFRVNFTAMIEGRTDLSVWTFGDGALEINEPYTAHSWPAPGDYLVSLWCFSDSYPGGVNATVTVHVVGPHYVAANSANPTPPYTSWATAATNIQDAIHVAEPGAQVLVTNGTYAPITANSLLSVRSINGAQSTIIDGGHSNRCASLENEVSLSGFTLTNGYAAYGGGASGGTLSNCVLSGNSAWASYGGGAVSCTLFNCALIGNSASDSGGGVAYGTLNNCLLIGNSATWFGGAAYGGTLNNCTVTGNSATNSGGGAYGQLYVACTLNNCIVYSNTAPTGANYALNDWVGINYCCTTPLATNGIGNITTAPLFVDQAGGNLRLQSNSPCINAGNNAYAPAGPDLDGNPRIKGATVDIGAYEFQSPASIVSYAWLHQYGLPTDGSADFADPDHDGLNNWQEWRCGTDPTSALSVLRLLPPVRTGTDVTLTWQSVAGVNYFLQRSTNLAASPVFVPLATNVFGQAGTTSFTDTNTAATGPFFYRVGVGN
jgi:hypothetical protein